MEKALVLVLVLVQIVLRTAATQAPGPWLNEASSVSGYPQDLHFRSVSAAQFTGSLRPSPTLREFACPALHPMHGCSTSTPSIKLSETKIGFQDHQQRWGRGSLQCLRPGHWRTFQVQGLGGRRERSTYARKPQVERSPRNFKTNNHKVTRLPQQLRAVSGGGSSGPSLPI